MTTDLAKVEANKIETSFQDIYGIADAFFKSGLFSDVRSQAQAVVKIMAGRELGLGPFYSMSRINIIQGKIGLAAETLGLLLKRSGKYDYTVKEHDDNHCLIEFTQGGKPVYESAFSMDDAKRAALIKQGSGWEKYPRAMLFSRALSQGARVVAPDAIGGAYTDEELQSIPKVEAEVEVEQPKPERLTAKEQAEFKPPVITSEPPITDEQVKALTHIRQKQAVLWGDALAIIKRECWPVEKLADMTQSQAAQLLKELQSAEV